MKEFDNTDYDKVIEICNLNEILLTDKILKIGEIITKYSPKDLENFNTENSDKICSMIETYRSLNVQYDKERLNFYYDILTRKLNIKREMFNQLDVVLDLLNTEEITEEEKILGYKILDNINIEITKMENGIDNTQNEITCLETEMIKRI
jgi:hypothetical protein